MKTVITTHYANPETKRPAAVGVYSPFQWAGNESNSRNRFDAMAKLSGFDILTAHVQGTGSVHIDRAVVHYEVAT